MIKPSICGVFLAFLILGTVCMGRFAVAQTGDGDVLPNADAAASDGESWRFLIEPYLMFPNMQGEVAVGRSPTASISENPDDIFDNLQAGLMLYAEAYSGLWAITSDLIYMELESDIESEGSIVSGEGSVQQTAWELAVLRRTSLLVEAGFGIQMNDIDSDLDLRVGGVRKSFDLKEIWVDPTLILRAKTPISQTWYLQTRANIGGFGVASDFTWQLQVHASWRPPGSFIFSAGYRAMGIDYDQGSGTDRFKYDITTFGPVLRFGFDF